jgi:hypothetical protein
MKDEYIIINKTAIQKIDELVKEANAGKTISSINSQMAESLIRFKEQLLSQSTPLIPEIEKAFDEGQNRMQHEIIEKLGLRYQTEQISQSTILNMEVHSEDYISNLKLDI